METISSKAELTEKKPVCMDLPRQICFVCSGNTCRSPMAAAVINHLSNGKYFALSCGTAVINGDKIAENAIIALENNGIASTSWNNYKSHSAKLVTKDIIVHSDMLVAMTNNHMIQLLYAFPEYATKFSVLPREIIDPYGKNQKYYDECLKEIIVAIKERFAL